MSTIEESLAVKRDKRFKILPDEWKEEAASAETADLKETIRQCAMNTEALRVARTIDEDLLKAKQTVATADAPYKDGIKMNGVKTEYAMFLLKERGEPVPGVDDFLKQDAESE